MAASLTYDERAETQDWLTYDEHVWLPVAGAVGSTHLR